MQLQTAQQICQLGPILISLSLPTFIQTKHHDVPVEALSRYHNAILLLVSVASTSLHRIRAAIGGSIDGSMFHRYTGYHLEDPARSTSKWETVNHYRDSPTLSCLLLALVRHRWR